MKLSQKYLLLFDVTWELLSQNGELELGVSILVGVRRHFAARLRKDALKCAVKHLNKVRKKVQPEIEILSDVTYDTQHLKAVFLLVLRFISMQEHSSIHSMLSL